ncbi:MAG: SDR family oxidoreductase [Planctomycetes bacterium]|nr:SDR family oxidoreductase [Planctomycetota bacterium]
MADARRIVMVTGGGSGLGRDLCAHFAERADRVWIADRDPDGAAATLEVVGSDRGRAMPLDVASPTMIDACVEEMGDWKPNVLVHCAGLQHVSKLEAFAPDRWKTLIDVMLTGPALLTRALLPSMRAAAWGRIILIGSIHSLVASPFKSAYVAAKHGLLGLAKTVALETADVDITINTICPSYIRTPLVERQIASQAAAHGISESEVVERIMLEPMPKRAFVTTEEVAGTIDFLCSPASRNITGQTVVIDGGWTAK